jgi:hypothetical protein
MSTFIFCEVVDFMYKENSIKELTDKGIWRIHILNNFQSENITEALKISIKMVMDIFIRSIDTTNFTGFLFWTNSYIEGNDIRYNISRLAQYQDNNQSGILLDPDFANILESFKLTDRIKNDDYQYFKSIIEITKDKNTINISKLQFSDEIISQVINRMLYVSKIDSRYDGAIFSKYSSVLMSKYLEKI